jgi:colanic acid/amylovoran biosynthesis glycosyltransferase
MRVAYLINKYPAVSLTFVRREILALERRGIEVLRISLRGWDDDLADQDDEIERKHTRYVLRDGAPALLWAVMRMLLTRPARLVRALAIVWQMGRRAERPLPVHLVYLAEACRIELWLRETGIQHLHAHFGTNSAEVAMLVEALGGPQWSFTVHGSELVDNPRFIGLAKKARHCAFVVAVCSFGRSQLYRVLDFQDWSKVQVVHCGLEPMEADSAHTANRFTCVGRLSAEKGQLLLIEAAARLAAQGYDFELVLVGDGERRPDIEALVARLKLQRHVRITGWVSGKNVRDEIMAARALVLPSFAEGIPMVVMEAMMLRRPVVATWVGGVPELVLSGEHGWLVPAGNVEALANAMRSCLETSADSLAAMGNAARERVLERHSVDKQAEKLGMLFQAAIDGANA